MANRAYKGTVFEREIAVALSRWWTNEDREDVFWRVGGSGGRARIRGRKGKNTVNQHGDIFAADPIGEPLMRLATIEVKKGYSARSIQDLLDHHLPTEKKKAAEQLYAEWIRKAEESQVQSGTYSWMLIVRRDQRRPLVLMPERLSDRLDTVMGFYMTFYDQKEVIIAYLLDDFFTYVKPDTIRSFIESYNWPASNIMHRSFLTKKLKKL